MARELSIIITEDGAEETQAKLSKVEDRIEGVEQAAGKTSEAMDDLSQAQDKATQSGGRLAQVFAKMGGPTGVATAAGTAMLFATKYAIDLTGNIDKLAKRAEVSIDVMQGLDAVARKNGSSFDMLSKAMFDLDAKLAKGGKQITATVSSIGLSVDGVLSLSRDERFREFAKAISSIEDPARRAGVMVELFGGQAQDLMPILQDVANGVDQTMPRISGRFVEAGAEMSQAWNMTLDTVTNRGQQFLAYLMLWPAALSSWAQDVSAAIWGAVGNLPTLPGQPNMGFPTGMPGFDPLGGQSMGFIERQLTQSAQAQIRASEQAARSGGRAARVIPFTSSPIVQGNVWNGGGFGMFRPGVMPNLPFPTLESSANLPWAGFAPTVMPNAPGVGGGGFGAWMRGSGGRIAGMGLGMLSGLIPGMSRTGSSVGSLAGSAIGSIGKIAGTALGPLLGPLGGIVGGLVGRLFGPREGVKTNRTRDAWITENFGSVQALHEAANEAGFSVERLLSVDRVKDFEAEVAKLNGALEEHASKRAAEAALIEQLNTDIIDTASQLEGLGADISGQFGPAIEQLREMGRISDETAASLLGMSGQVDFRKMEQAAQRLGITDMSGLGQGYQTQRIGAEASSMVNDIDLLIRGGADLNAVLGGSSEKLSGLVVDAMKFGVELPEQMKPWIEQLAASGKLVDENGEKLTDVSQLKFGKPIETEFEKLIRKLDEFIGRLGGPLTDALEDIPSEIDIDMNVDVNPRYNSHVEPGGDTGPGFDRGGVVGRDWRRRSMRDTIPAWLRPGEMVITPEQRRSGGGGGVSVSIGNLSVGPGASRAQTAETVGEAVVAYMERRGVRFGRRVA